MFAGVIAAVLIGGGLLAVFLYALFWADAQIRRGLMTEESLPGWWYLGVGIPGLIGAGCVWVALY